MNFINNNKIFFFLKKRENYYFKKINNKLLKDLHANGHYNRKRSITTLNTSKMLS